jgi:rubrerythrin
LRISNFERDLRIGFGHGAPRWFLLGQVGSQRFAIRQERKRFSARAIAPVRQLPHSRAIRRQAMAVTIPAGAPQTLGEAFAHIGQVQSPTIDDMKIMVLVEAAGLALYEGLAGATTNAEVQTLLRCNGREEMAHAHRVAKAIKAMTGEDYPPPSVEDNPYLSGPLPTAPVTPEGLAQTAQAEFAGDALYAGWADAVGHEEAAALFRQNGKEETDHGNRLMQAAALLAG